MRPGLPVIDMAPLFGSGDAAGQRHAHDAVLRLGADRDDHAAQ
jgi:hypothetical protein